MPIAIARLKAIPGAGGVVYRGSGTEVQVASGTSIVLPLPTGVAVGDLLVAVVMRRSTATTLPSGWTLASAAGPATNGTNQWSDVYTKTATSGDISTGSATFGQTSAGRMNGQMLSMYAAGGTPVLESQSTDVVNNASTNFIAVPSLSAVGNGRLGVAAASSLLANTSPTTTTWTTSGGTGWTLRTASAVDLRLGVFTKPLNAGDTTSFTATSTTTINTNGLTANALIFAPP